MNGKLEAFPSDLREELNSAGYQPAQVYKYLDEKKYSRVVELCRAMDDNLSRLPSVQLAHARALFHTGQLESANLIFDKVLSREPENVMALKYLGDIRFADSDEYSALTYYNRILEIDPETTLLACSRSGVATETTRTVTLVRAGEKPVSPSKPSSLRQIHFFTETMGDLYLSQGHSRMALKVFEKLSEREESPRLREKLKLALERIKDKEG